MLIAQYYWNRFYLNTKITALWTTKFLTEVIQPVTNSMVARYCSENAPAGKYVIANAAVLDCDFELVHPSFPPNLQAIPTTDLCEGAFS